MPAGDGQDILISGMVGFFDGASGFRCVVGTVEGLILTNGPHDGCDGSSLMTLSTIVLARAGVVTGAGVEDSAVGKDSIDPLILESRSL